MLPVLLLFVLTFDF